MGLFEQKIAAAAPDAGDGRNRKWVYVPYDRLTDAVGPLSELAAADTGIVMLEALAKARRRPYHKKKLTLILASQRQFALEQAARGVKVAYVQTPGIFADGLVLAKQRYGLDRLVMMEPAEREMRLDMADARQKAAIGQAPVLEQVADATWLSTVEDFEQVYGKPGAGPVTKHHLMDRFYRSMREKTGYLMRGGKPEGGQFSYDADNRKPYKGQPAVPRRPAHAPDALTREVMELVEREFASHFGTTQGWDMPVRLEDIEAEWQRVLRELLPVFGPYEDAMVATAPDMFHSRMSAYLNISRLLPRRVVEDVVEAAASGAIPLASAEGFVRQLLGWREYMRHIHRITDGFRQVGAAEEPKRKGSTMTESAADPDPDPGARPSALGASRSLPAVYWGVESGLRCMDTVVAQVRQEGWSHHITRLMVLSNFATLCGYSPRELTDWFWVAYIDAYDWVVEPNVLGMGTFGDGGITATKPYVSGAAYINRMGDYCGGCQYNPKISTGAGACPFTALYWTFLERHEALLGRNPRMSMPYASLRKKSPDERTALRKTAEACVDELAKVQYTLG